MNRQIEPDNYGADLRLSCLADFLELEAFSKGKSRSEADLADLINDSKWQDVLASRYEGPGIDRDDQVGDSQERSRECASVVFNLLEQRASLLDSKYPFTISGARRLERTDDQGVYLWFLFVSLCHSLKIDNVPPPTEEFERIVAIGLSAAGLPAKTFGTSMRSGTFRERVQELANHFTELHVTIENAVVSLSQNDGGIDTFAMLRCHKDRRHAQWAFIGQSTVGKTETWRKKINQPKPPFWSKIFADRIVPVAFFATPHHVQDDCLSSLADENTCILDRMRLAYWTADPPASFDAYASALRGVELAA